MELLFVLEIYLLTLISKTLIVSSNKQIDPLIVNTQSGSVKGRLDFTIGQNKSYYIFQGIPYAQPPVGNLRFEPPIYVYNWDGILDATEYRGDCAQIDTVFKGSEDCLHLNIYTPKTGYYHRLPVMVWIYGGGFSIGTSSKETYGPDYFIDQNITIVTVNYRLNIFGFLSTKDLIVPGNNGLKDQALALLWIKKNIKAFGGDPNKITLFGESAGAVSVTYHLTAHQSIGLYRNAIMQSGSSLGLWSLSRQMDRGLSKLSAMYNATSIQNLIDNLRAADTQTLTNHTFQIITEYQLEYGQDYIFGPVIEPDHPDAFITGKPHQMLSKKQFNHVPVILGFNSFEALNYLYALSLVIEANALDLVPTDLNLVNENEYNAVRVQVESYYFNNKSINSQLYEALQFSSDNVLVRSVRETALLLAKDVPVYFYVFGYMGNLGIITDHQRPFPGVGHAEELYYMWRKDSNETTDNSDTLVRSRLVKLWTNFSKYNCPTISLEDPELNNFLWPQVNSTDRELLYVNITEEFDIKLNPHKNNMLFWDKIYSQYGHPPFDTY